MSPNNDLKDNKIYLIAGQIGVLFLAMVSLFWIMALHNKERIVTELMGRLDASTQAMAAQLKANQVPFSASSVEPGVFIINQTDGTVVIDRRNGGEAQQRLWERYKTKIIYEMQKQKRGWSEYPDKNAWVFNEPRRIIRYLSIDELNWILAVEDVKPAPLDLLRASIGASTYVLVFFIFALGAGALWWLTDRYFLLIKRQISASVEDNILSLSGEEKVWSKTSAPKEPGVEFQIPEAKAAPKAVEDPIMDEAFQRPQPLKVPEPIKKPVDKEPIVDVAHIKSPVLKKMLQQFRKK